MSERFAIAYPIEAEIKPGGLSAIFHIVSSDEEMTAIAMKEMDKEFGSSSRKLSDEEAGSRLTFGFSASKWKMCNWDPQGPKKNWVIQPPDPQAN